MADEYLSTDPSAGEDQPAASAVTEPEQPTYLTTDPLAGGLLGGALSGYEPVFAEAGARHGVDPAFLMAVSQFETGDGTSHALRAYNNPAGLMDPRSRDAKGFQQFESIDQGIDAMASNLKRNYIDKGLTTIPAIAQKYAPVGASNDPNATNNEWPAAVGRNYARNLDQVRKGQPVEQVDQEVRVEKGVPVNVREIEVARALPAEGPKPQTTNRQPGEYISTDPNAGGDYISTDPNAGMEEDTLATAGATRISDIASDLLQDPNAIQPPTQTYPVPPPVVPGNIDLNNRPVVQNADGTVSTEKSFSIGTPQGEVLIPQVVGGKMVSKDEAIQHYNNTGEHLGIFETPEQADAYAGVLHQRLGTGPEWQGNPPPPTLADRAGDVIGKIFGISAAQREAGKTALATQAQAEPLVAPWAKPYVDPAVEKAGAVFDASRQFAGEAAKAGMSYMPPVLAARTLLPPENPLRQAAEGLMEASKQFTLTMTEPDNLALMVATGGTGAGARVMAGMFGAQMASTIPDQWQAFKEAKTVAEKTSIAAQALATLGFIATTGAHAVAEPGAVPGGPPARDLSPEQQAIVDKTNAALAAKEPPPQVQPSGPGPLVTETAQVQPGGAATADVTRAIVDRRNALVAEAQQLGVEVDRARQMGMRPHPNVEARIAEINQELNQPARGSLERSFPPGEEPAPLPTTETPTVQTTASAPTAEAPPVQAAAPITEPVPPLVQTPGAGVTSGGFGLENIRVPGVGGEPPRVLTTTPKLEPWEGPAPEGFSLEPQTSHPYAFSDETRSKFGFTGRESSAALQRLAEHTGEPLYPVEYGGGESSQDLSGSPARDNIRKITRLIEANGGKPTWFRSSGQPIPYSAAHVLGSREVLLNADMPGLEPVREVASHEFGHFLRSNSPEIWADLRNHIERTADPTRRAAYEQRLAQLRYPSTDWQDEMVSDVVKEALRDPLRFRRAVGDNMFLRVADRLRTWLTNMIGKIRGGPKGRAFEDLTTDLAGTRRKVMDAITGMQREARGGEAIGEGGLRFARIEPAARGPVEQGLQLRATQERAARANVETRRVAGEARGVRNEDATLISTRRPSTNKVEDANQTGDNRLHLGVFDKWHPEFQAKVVAKLRPWLPRELTKGVRDHGQIIENAINFFKEHKLILHRLAEQQPWLERAMRQYEGYNIHGHNLVDQYGFTPEGVFGAETVMSSGKSPDASFSMAERLMRVMRQAGDVRWDNRFDKTVKSGGAQGKGIPITGRDLREIRGKTFNELTDHIQKAQWARVYDQTFHETEYPIITPEGTKGPLESTVEGKPATLTWTSFPEIAKALRLLDGTTKPSEVIETAKHSNYYNSKRSPGSHTSDYVADRHDVSGSFLMPLGSHPTIPKKAHPLLTDHFSSLYNAATGDYGIHALHVEAGRRAAAEAGLTPSDFQAGHWSYQRGFMSPRVLGENAARQIQNVWKDTYRGKRTIAEARAEALRIAGDTLAEKIRKTGYDPTPAWARESQGSVGAAPPGARRAGDTGELPQARGAGGAAGPGGRGRPAAGTPESGVEPRILGSRIDEPPSQADFEDASASNDRQKMRGHIATVQRMTEVSPDVKAQVQSWYEPTTLDTVNRAANGTIDRLGLDEAKRTFMGSRTNDATNLALGHNLALRYDQQGRFEDAADVRDRMAEKLTTPAQTLWYISTIGKTSPEGLIRTAQKLMTDQVAGDPAKQQLLEQISRLRQQLAALPEGKAKDAATRVVVRQLGQVDKPGQRLSQDQLNKLLEQHAQGQLGPDQLAQSLNKYFKIPRLSPGNQAKILAAQKAWADTPADNPLLKLKRAGDMMDSVYGLVPRTFWDKVRAASVISMILHGKLPVRIGISNAVKMIGQTLVDTIQNIPADMGNVASGRKTVTAGQLAAIKEGLTEPVRAYRAGYTDAKLRGLSTMKSFSEGMRTLIDLANLTTRGLYEASDVTRATHTFSSRVGRLFEDTVTLVHNVVPYAFWNAGFKSSLARQMRLAGVETPTADMVTNAQIDGNKAIFYNDTALSKGLIAVRKTLDLPTAKITGGKYGFGTATIPFAKVPSAIITEGLAWTPFGLTRAGWEILRPHVTGEPINPRAAGEAIIKAALGTGSALLAGYQLQKIGVLTGAPDDNKELEAMRRASGWGAYKVNLSELKRRMSSGNWWTKSATPADGDLITNYNWLEPIAFTVAMGADIAHSQDKREIDLKRGKITSNAVISALEAGFGSVAEAPMLQGIQHFMAAAGEGRFGNALAGIVANVPGNFVPSLVRQTSQKMDNTVRETQGGTIAQQEMNKILVQIPGLSQRYPVNYDIFGEAMQRYNYGNNSLINVFFNPAMVSRFQSNPQLAEMQRIYETTGANKASLRQVPATLMINGKQVQLTNEQVSAYQHYVGKESSTVITRLMASPQFAGEPLLTKQAVISQVLGAVNNAAKMDLFGQAPVTVGVGARGPTLSKPSPMDIAALLGGRQQGLNRPPGATPAGPRAPAWQTVPQPALPSLAP